MKQRLLWAMGAIALGTIAASASTAQTEPRKEYRLEPVVVTATRSSLALDSAPASVAELDEEQVQESPNISLDDILRTVPGFSTFRRSSSIVTSPDLDNEAQGVTLRGIGPSGTSRALVMVDGIPIINPFDAQVFWGKVAKEQIERIEVVRGASAHLWGNYAMAGVINIITRKPRGNHGGAHFTYGTHDLVDSGFFATGEVGKLQLGVDGNYFDTIGFKVVDAAQRGPIDGRSSSRSQLLNARAAYRLSDTASVAVHGQIFDQDNNNGTRLRVADSTSGLVDMVGTAHSDDGSEWQLSAFSNLQRFSINFINALSVNGVRRAGESLDFKQIIPVTDVGGSLVWSRRMTDPLLLTAGLDLHWIDGQSREQHYLASGEKDGFRRADGKQLFAGLFMQGIYTPTERWEIALGGRVDVWSNYDGSVSESDQLGSDSQHFRSHTEATFNPKLAVLYRALDWLHVRGAAYRAFRAPTLSELYREGEVEGLQFRPNAKLGPEDLYGAELGLDMPLLDTLDVRTTGFWADIDGGITDFTTVENGSQVRTRNNTGLTRTVGAELEILYQVWRDVTLSGSYLYSDSEVVRAPTHAEIVGDHVTQVPPHSFTLSGRYSNPAIISFLVEGRFVDAQYEDAENQDRLRSYFLVLASATRDLPWFNSQIYVAAQNLADRTYDVDRGGGVLKVGTPFMAHAGFRFRL